ncbi:PTS 2-O-a-mannosyl-D-glycerate transporter subunit IIABC [Macrococcus sp. EM39E]|uniref:PTS 2-O-a-mannosyl-D-glycerate transporter subunit IIABC n=1 Tax=Macrococcus animalis TaxID=3395467 RepID=UPI0039BEABFC
MNLSNLTNENLILVNQEFSKKEELIFALSERLFAEGKISSVNEFYEDVLLREKQTPTGFEGGLAIPHAKSQNVKVPCFAVSTLSNSIEDWESVDPNNKVKLVILLAIPETEGDKHLKILSEFVTRLSDEDYKNKLMNSHTSLELLNNIDIEKEAIVGNNVDSNADTILAITACPAGIAHTYMAAEALVKAGEKKGVRVLVEKQGANGIEDKFTQRDINNAKGIIYANDVAIIGKERFDNLPQIQTSVASPLRNGEKLIDELLVKSSNYDYKEIDRNNENESDNNYSVKTEIKDSVLTGISYMIPVIIAGGMTLAFAVFIAQIFGLQEVYDTEGSWLWLIRQLGGGMLGQLMVPILAAYMAYSIADKPALGPGFAAGLAANLIGSGFIGGMVGGLVAGYFLKFLKAKVKPKGTFAGFVSFWVYPVVGTIVVGLIMLFLIGQPLAMLNGGLIKWLESMSGTNAILFGAIIGMMVSFDLGGPVNKAAYAFCIAAMASNNFLPYAIFASVKMVSAFSVTGATIIAKDLFSKEEQEVGKQTWLLGLAGITEGAIPFALNDPFRVIPSFLVGSAVTGAIVGFFGIGLTVPGAGIFSLALLNGKPMLIAASIWLGAALIGAAISMTLLVLTRKMKKNKLA